MQALLQSVQSWLQTVQTRLQSVQTQLQTVQARLQSVHSRLQTLKRRLQRANPARKKLLACDKNSLSFELEANQADLSPNRSSHFAQGGYHPAHPRHHCAEQIQERSKAGRMGHRQSCGEAHTRETGKEADDQAAGHVIQNVAFAGSDRSRQKQTKPKIDKATGLI